MRAVDFEDKLEPELQIAPEPAAGKSASTLREGEDAALMDATLTSALSPEVQALIGRMLDGTEPQEQGRRVYQVKKFSPQHVNIVLLRLAGFKPKEVAEILN